MRKGWLLAAIFALAAACAAELVAQDSSSYSKQETAQATEQNASPVTVTGKGT